MSKKDLKEKNEYFVKKAATLAAFEAQKAAEEKASQEKVEELIAETPEEGEVTAQE